MGAAVQHCPTTQHTMGHVAHNTCVLDLCHIHVASKNMICPHNMIVHVSIFGKLVRYGTVRYGTVRYGTVPSIFGNIAAKFGNGHGGLNCAALVASPTLGAIWVGCGGPHWPTQCNIVARNAFF